MPKINVDCTTSDCPHFKTCCQLPTEVHPINGKIDIIFVGQGGGKDEERLKRPWIGRAGQLLRNVLRTLVKKKPIGIALSNTVRCHPTEQKDGRLKDRAPTDDEVRFCIKYLERDIESLKPSVIMPLGRDSASRFGFDGYVGQMRQKSLSRNFSEVFMTYHPSGVLQSGMKYFEDFRKDILAAYKVALLKRNG